MAQSFTNYLKEEGFITSEQAEACQSQNTDSGLSPEQEGQQLVDAQIMTAKELADALFYFNMNNFVEENTVTLSSDHMDDDFFTEYINIIKRGFADFLHVKVTCTEANIYASLQEEIIIYQPLLGQEDNMFLTGIKGSEDYLTRAATVLHKKLAENVDLPPFNPTKEDMLDFYFELLNNINSTCSYKFNINFDMELPLYQENAILNASRIYTADIAFNDFVLNMFLICGGSSWFERVDEKTV
jgi:hypothetical protein